MALEFARFQATSHSRIMGQPRLQRVVMTGLAFEGEGPHKAADYFARSPLKLSYAKLSCVHRASRRSAPRMARRKLDHDTCASGVNNNSQFS